MYFISIMNYYTKKMNTYFKLYRDLFILFRLPLRRVIRYLNVYNQYLMK